MSELTEKIIGNGKLTATARIAIVIFSVIGTSLAPFILHAVLDVNTTLNNIDTRLAVQAEHTKTQDTRLDAIETVNKAEDLLIYNHGERIIRLESKAGLQ